MSDLIILGSSQFQLCSEVVREVIYEKADEIIQLSHLWTSEMRFVRLFPPSQRCG